MFNLRGIQTETIYDGLAVALFQGEEALARQFVEFCLSQTDNDGRLNEETIHEVADFVTHSSALRGEFTRNGLVSALRNVRLVA
ncbi:MAG: hypothetical protein [Podoviridae sp. ctDWo9]|nr:MAG: hypothetical protein [Podoviridae sp. ctDWo9]